MFDHSVNIEFMKPILGHTTIARNRSERTFQYKCHEISCQTSITEQTLAQKKSQTSWYQDQLLTHSNNNRCYDICIQL